MSFSQIINTLKTHLKGLVCAVETHLTFTAPLPPFKQALSHIYFGKQVSG